MTPQAPKLAEDISDRIQDAYQVFDDAMGTIEAECLRSAKPGLTEAHDLYHALYLEANAVIQNQLSSLGGIESNYGSVNELLRIIIATSALGGYLSQIDDIELHFDEILDIDMVLTPVDGVYNHTKVTELGKQLGYLNKTDDLRRILNEDLYAE